MASKEFELEIDQAVQTGNYRLASELCEKYLLASVGTPINSVHSAAFRPFSRYAGLPCSRPDPPG